MVPCSAWTMHTWQQRLCFPQVWAISHTRHTKGHLQMRSSVLFWYWWILWRATIPGWYLQGLFSPPLINSNVASLLAGHWGPHLCCQPSQHLGWGILEISLWPAALPPASSSSPSLLVREVHSQRMPPSGDPFSSLPLVLLSSSPSEID